jgi:hypothetical protein
VYTPNRGKIILPVREVLFLPLLGNFKGEKGCIKPLRMIQSLYLEKFSNVCIDPTPILSKIFQILARIIL